MNSNKCLDIFQLNKDQKNKLEEFKNYILEINKHTNLISTQDEKQLISKHFYDSLFLQKELSLFTNQQNIIDLGSGGGFPGLILAIAFPNHQFTLIDSTNKKIDFLSNCIDDLQLKNARAIAARFEELGADENFRQQFDIATARALAPLPTLLEYISPFLKDQALFFAYKSKKTNEELKSSNRIQDLLDLKYQTEILYNLPEEQGDRKILKFKQNSLCPEKFPRRINKAKKHPLI